jgi:CheY-like chemotaxis protein
MESILIIDDDVELCRMLDDYLTPHDIRLSMMHHAADGMAAVRRGGFDLLILDVMLPGLDGFAVLRAIRQWSDIGVLSFCSVPLCGVSCASVRPQFTRLRQPARHLPCRLRPSLRVVSKASSD